MATVERLLTHAPVEIAPEDPTSGAARFCLQSYFAELDRRFDDGFDPDMSIRAEADDEAGATAVRLETNQRLTEAIGLYAPPAIGRSPPSTTRPTPTTGSRRG